MPDPNAVAGDQTPKPDPYDLGDTSLFPADTPAATPSTLVAPPKSSEGTPLPSEVAQPRNPDGTFDTKPGNHPPELKEQAIDYGYSDEDIANSTSGELRRGIATMKRNREKFRHQQQEALARDALLNPPKPAPQSAQQPAAPEPEYDLGLGQELEAELDPRLVKALKDKFKSLESRVAAIDQRDTLRTVSTNAEKIDAAFAALPASHQKLFGTMSAEEMTDAEKATFLKRRLAVLNEAGVNIKAVTGRIGQQIKKAAETLYGPAVAEAPKPAEPEPYTPGKPALRVSPEDWEEGALRRPTQRSGAAEPKGEELAKANLRRKLGDEAVETSGDVDVLDGLLG